jgi:lipopolysaccharide export LptBFGC system permease protein LptF
LYDISRPLTNNEIKALKTVFYNDVDYSKIRIKTAALPTSLAAYVFNNQIIYRSQYHIDDFSEDYLKTAMLVHETGHVWANQRKGFISSLIAGAEHIFYGDDVYTHTSGNKNTQLSLDDFRYEQQCRILSDFYVKRYLKFDEDNLDKIIYRTIKRSDLVED